MHNKFKNVIISGASSGIGRTACQYYLTKGFRVYGISRTKSGISNSNFIEILQDLEDEKGLKKSIKKVNFIDGIHALINCAGVTLPSQDLPSLEVMKRTFNVNLFGTYSLILEVLPHLIKCKNSTIVNIASIGGVTGFSGNPAYGASKAAIINLTQNLALDLAKYEVRVNCVSPGYFKTDMTSRSYKDPILRSTREKNTVMNRYGEPCELMGILEFLTSPASSYVTGQNFIIDGGWTAKGYVE